ncbi:MAG TPA: NAD-dependent succinate-semialdehyde dehydrogenase [Jatrophihabitans sp.]|nr:NAD-dependent succinate-semialdehyde dehydrogenase [Jatrophihabitans sp.]
MHVTADDERAVIDKTPRRLYVGGQWRDAASGRTFPVEDPSTGEVLCSVADATPKDALAALAAAAQAQDEWAARPPRERGEILQRASELMRARIDELALLMTLEMGKPLAESRGEVTYAAEFFRWFAEQAVRVSGRYATSPDGRSRFLISSQPVGPSVLVTPWNFPLAMGTRKIGPALAAGCTAVVKPAEQTPLSMLALAGILEDAGTPPGVVNLVTTSDPGAVVRALLDDGRARKLSFTGSTEVGRLLMANASTHLMRISMELGGNAPLLVLADADLDVAVDGAMQAKMRNIGEACTAANRIFVAEQIADEFVERLAARMGALTVGRGTEPGVDVGPLIDPPAVAKVTRLVDDAVTRGAKVVVGGAALPGAGHFYRPTVLTNVAEDSAMLAEEIFGPVAPILTFAAEDEAIARANATPYGLVSYLFSRDLDRALRVADRLEAGMVGINQGIVSNPAAPFGGVKHSGLGREGGLEGIEEFLETKYVATPA